MTLIDFYEGLHACVRLSSCDKTTAISMFSWRARILYFYLRSLILHHAKANPEHAMGLECLASRYKGGVHYLSRLTTDDDVAERCQVRPVN